MICPKCCRPVDACVCSPLAEAEVAALRKRVDSQQAEINTLVVELGVERKRVEELEQESKTFEDQAVFYQARAEKAERERDEAIDERDVLMEAHQALGHEYEMQGRALDDYRAKAIQRQQDFDGAAHGCDVLQGNLDALQADLDAALDFCGKMLGWSPGLFSQSDGGKRILALLEKRREARRG